MVVNYNVKLCAVAGSNSVKADAALCCFGVFGGDDSLAAVSESCTCIRLIHGVGGEIFDLRGNLNLSCVNVNVLVGSAREERKGGSGDESYADNENYRGSNHTELSE